MIPELLIEHPDLPKPAPMTESWQRKSLFEAIARAVRSASKPLLLVLDDAQWADGETLEWIHYLLREQIVVADPHRGRASDPTMSVPVAR